MLCVEVGAYDCIGCVAGVGRDVGHSHDCLTGQMGEEVAS